MFNNIEAAFKKLLGKGRAFLTPGRFMSDFLDFLISPLSEIEQRIKNLKLTHFPTKFVDEKNILNGEELFGIEDIETLSLSERAANVESQWSVFGGSQSYKQLELILQKKGLPVKIIENIPKEYKTYGYRYIGNGQIQTDSEKKDPIVLTNGKHSFIIQATDFIFSQELLATMIEAIVKNKPAHNGAFFIPRFLRKKEIHNVLTKRQMQALRKRCYCDCRTTGEQ